MTSNGHGQPIGWCQRCAETGALPFRCYWERFHFSSYFNGTCECDYIFVMFRYPNYPLLEACFSHNWFMVVKSFRDFAK